MRDCRVLAGFSAGIDTQTMKAESAVFAIVGMFFGLIVGWVLGTQQPASSRAAGTVGSAPSVQQTSASPAKAIDDNQVATLRAEIQRDPNSVQARVGLGNLYYDAERYDEAAKWYEEAMKLDPRDVNVSTDLGVSYYNLGQPDKALQQFERSLSIDPKHAKTLLNQGMVRAFGKQDLDGAAVSWQKVVDVAPESPEGQKAKQMLDGLKSAHPGGSMPASTPRG
jgi:Tfp pilus assembly protein PilF